MIERTVERQKFGSGMDSNIKETNGNGKRMKTK
jgi:hypothetical protein